MVFSHSRIHDDSYPAQESCSIWPDQLFAVGCSGLGTRLHEHIHTEDIANWTRSGKSAILCLLIMGMYAVVKTTIHDATDCNKVDGGKAATTEPCLQPADV